MKKIILSLMLVIMISLTYGQSAKTVLTKPGINSKTQILTTSEEINFLQNTTSNIQSQLGNKIGVEDTTAMLSIYARTQRMLDSLTNVRNTFPLKADSIGLSNLTQNVEHALIARQTTVAADAKYVAKDSIIQASTLYYKIPQTDSVAIATSDSVKNVIINTTELVDELKLMKGWSGDHLPVGAYLNSGSFGLTDNRLIILTFVFPVEKTVYGIYFQLETSGVYTADGENGFIMGIRSGTNAYADTITGSKVLSTTMWSGSVGINLVTFPTPIVIPAGSEIKLGVLYNNSAQTTAPALAKFSNLLNNSRMFGGLNTLCGRQDGVTTFGATLTLTSSGESSYPSVWLKETP